MVYSEPWKEYISALEKEFSRLRNANLNIKSEFAQATLNYFGHVIRYGNYRPSV